MNSAIEYRKASIPTESSPEEALKVIKVLKENGENEKSLNLTREALAKYPNNELIFIEFCLAVEAHISPDEAIKAIRKGISISPKSEPLKGTLLGILFRIKNFKDADKEIDKFIAEIFRKHPNEFNIHNAQTMLTSICFNSMYRDDISDHDKWILHKKFGDFLTKVMPKIENSSEPLKTVKRIGFVSNQLFRNHPVGRFSIDFIQELSKKEYEIYIYHNTSNDHEAYSSVEKQFSDFTIKIRKISSEQPVSSAKIVKDDKIDLLIDLSGCTEGNMLPMFSCRPAPIQLSWVGYPGHPGIKEIDYFLSDKICSPNTQATPTDLIEKIYRYDRFFTSYGGSNIQSSFEIPAETKNNISFGSFNNIDKISRSTIKNWAAVLRAVPNSTISLKFFKSTKHQIDFITETFVSLGIDQSRIMIMPKSSTIEDTLRSYDELDIALDTFPYNGMTTTCDALWMGVPVVTCYGTTHVSCASSSILHSIGASELVANDWKNFVKISKDLASDIQRIKFYKKNLRKMMLNSDICDHKGMISHFEKFIEFTTMGK